MVWGQKQIPQILLIANVWRYWFTLIDWLWSIKAVCKESRSQLQKRRQSPHIGFFPYAKPGDLILDTPTN